MRRSSTIHDGLCSEDSSSKKIEEFDFNEFKGFYKTALENLFGCCLEETLQTVEKRNKDEQKHTAQENRPKHGVDVNRPKTHLSQIFWSVSKAPLTVGKPSISQICQVMLNILGRVCVFPSHLYKWSFSIMLVVLMLVDGSRRTRRTFTLFY